MSEQIDDATPQLDGVDAEASSKSPVGTGMILKIICMFFGICIILGAVVWFIFVGFKSPADALEDKVNSQSILSSLMGQNNPIAVETSEDEEGQASSPPVVNTLVASEFEDLLGQMAQTLVEIASNQDAFHNELQQLRRSIESDRSAVVTHAKQYEALESQLSRLMDQSRNGLRVLNRHEQTLTILSDQVANLDGSLTNEFRRFPIFVWGTSSWGGRLTLSVSHQNAPTITHELKESDSFHGWTVESISSQKAVFRSGEQHHEVTL